MKLLLFLTLSLSAQQITVNNIQPGSKQGNGTKIQLAGHINNSVGNTICTDANGNTTTDTCTNGIGSVNSSHPGILVAPTTGNVILFQKAPVTITYSASPTFDLSKGDFFVITLNGDALSPIWMNAVPGQSFRIEVCQDSSGNHNFQMPSSVTGGMTPGLAPTKCSMQRISTLNGSTFQAEAPGIINQ